MSHYPPGPDGYWFIVDPPLLTALGRVTYSSGYLEAILATIRSHSRDEPSLAWDKRDGFATALKSFREELRGATDCAQRQFAESWVQRADEAYEQRNQIVHATWTADGSDLTRRYILVPSPPYRNKPQRPEITVTAADLDLVGQRLERVGLEGLDVIAWVKEPGWR